MLSSFGSIVQRMGGLGMCRRSGTGPASSNAVFMNRWMVVFAVRALLPLAKVKAETKKRKKQKEKEPIQLCGKYLTGHLKGENLVD
jgi:hypothetical protein